MLLQVQRIHISGHLLWRLWVDIAGKKIMVLFERFLLFFTCGLLAFCIEINNCYRYLAVVSALTTEADFVFCPELPPPEDWQTRLCTKLEQVFFHSNDMMIN